MGRQKKAKKTISAGRAKRRSGGLRLCMMGVLPEFVHAGSFALACRRFPLSRMAEEGLGERAGARQERPAALTR
ncbi:hypothetical protein CS8_007750 [Cupriavidus sp. 8B]